MTPTRILVLVVWFLLAATVRADLHGSWTATPREDGTFQMQFARERHYNDMSMPLSAFSGLSETQVSSPTQTQVAFELRRDAGTLAMEGVFKQREGAGHFNFRPNRGYFDQIRALGVAVGDDDREEQLFMLAMLDVSPAFIKSMQEAGYRVSLKQYTTMRIFRVTPQLLDELRSLGYRDIPVDDLIATRVHGATPQFVRELRELGYSNIPIRDLVAMRIHRVTPEYIRELKSAGYANIPVRKLIDMRIHGIDAGYIAKMK